MKRSQFIRLRGSVVAISTFFAIVALYLIIDNRDTTQFAVATSAATRTNPAATVPLGVATTIPIDNRLCGLAERLGIPDNADMATTSRALLTFYTEAAQFTQAELHGNVDAARRYYADLIDVGTRGGWDVQRIVRNKEGDRWRALVAASPAGLDEARSAVLELCRVTLPPPPLVELDSNGEIKDPALRKLLAQVDKELPPAAAASTTRSSL